MAAFGRKTAIKLLLGRCLMAFLPWELQAKAGSGWCCFLVPGGCYGGEGEAAMARHPRCRSYRCFEKTRGSQVQTIWVETA